MDTAAAAAPAPKPACPADRPDRVSAQIAARLCGGEVEVSGELSETDRVWAMPNGSMRAERSLGVARFKRDNRWVDVDLTLERLADGSVRPKAHPGDLKLSGKAPAQGKHVLAAMGSGDRQIGLGWNGKLPEPVLEGAKATYPEVFPGVDLVVEVTRAGFEQLLVVKSRAAIGSVKRVQMDLSLRGAQAEADAEGGLVFKDAKGTVVGRTPAPVMWDAAVDPLSKEPLHPRRVGLAMGRQPSAAGSPRDLTLSADEAWLADPARRYPVTIDPYVVDPSWVSFDTYVNSSYTDDLSTWDKIALGTTNSGATKRIGYINLRAHGMAGSRINWATLKLWGQQASSCEPGTWQVWRTSGPANTATRWGNRPALLQHMGNSSGPNNGQCINAWVEADLTALYQYMADNSVNDFSAGLAPYWDDTNAYYKEFKSTESGTLPHVSLSWNEPPDVEGPSTVPSTACVIGGDRPHIATLTPRLSTGVSDSDGAASNLNFEWWVTGGSKIGGASANGVASGYSGSVDVPAGAFANGGTYSWKVRAADPGGLPVSGWSSWCEFTVDTTKPGAPLVSTKDGKYPSIQQDNTWGHGGYGQGGLFTLAPASGTNDLQSFVYQLDNQASPTTANATAALDVTVTPSEDGVRTLTVWAKDKAGNQSEPAKYVFNVGRAGMTQPLPGANVVKRAKLGVEGDSTYTRARFQYRRGPGGAEYDIPLAHLNTATGQPVTTAPVSLSSLGGHATWNAIDTLGTTGGVAQIRARMYKDGGYVPDLSVRNPQSGRCVDVEGYGTTNGTRISIHDCHGGTNQKWEMRPNGTIVNPHSGRCLDLEAYGTTNGTPTHLWDCNGTANQIFVRLPSGQLRNPVSGRCLDLIGPGTANGTRLHLWDCHSGWSQIYTDIETAYDTQWITVNVDPNGDGAASTDVGPGSANLLTGDYGLSSTDIDEFGMAVMRTASSREPADGWTPQGERLTANQQQVSTDTAGFSNYSNIVDLVRVTDRGQGSSTDSLRVTPVGTKPAWIGEGDTFSQIGSTDMSLGVRPGKRYRFSGWIYVPSATGLNPTDARGLRLTAHTQGPSGNTVTQSVKAAWVDAWQELTVDFTVPADANMAFLRLYNGMNFGSGRQVYFDNLSLRELVAPFGPSWRGGVSDAVTANEYVSLEFPSPDLAKVNMVGGSQITFAKSVSNDFFPQPGAESLSLAKLDANTYRLSEIDGTVVEFTKPSGANAFMATSTWTSQAGGQSASTSRYVFDTTDNRTLVKKVISPGEAGVGDCQAATPARGCEVLEYVYANDRVDSVKIWSWDPAANGGAGAMADVVVAKYVYDGNGRLIEVFDPRLSQPLKTTYDYDAAGRVTKVTPAGQLPWMLDYAAVGSDPNAGWIQRVRRASLVQGTKNQLGPENVTKMVYQVPLTRGAGGPHDMSHTAITQWGQKDIPTDATAVFGPQESVSAGAATPSAPGADGYGFATVHYLNANGQEVNTATPSAGGVNGASIDTVQYDRFGNTIWTLEATNRLIALGQHPDSATLLGKLNLAGLASTELKAHQLASTSAYSLDGLDLLEKTGPRVLTVLEAAHGSHAAGSTVVGRPKTLMVYDEGKPDGQAYHLETTETVGLEVAGVAGLADARVSKTGYDPINGSASGWQLKQATVSTSDATGANLSAYVVFDSEGKTLKSWGIGSNGGDARAKQTIYYTAGTNAADAACGNKPEWASQPCLTKFLGNVTGHDPARMTTTLPERRVTAYDRYGNATVVKETNDGKTRTTTTVYDTADRVSSVVIASVGDGAAQLDSVVTEYDPATGLVLETKAGTATVTREYDLLGRVVAYTDADGETTRSEFDQFGRAAKSIDSKGTQTYAYDRGIEPRGLLTSTTDSAVGVFHARYSPDGQLVEVKYPGGMTRRDALDANLEPEARSYTRDSDGAVIYAESIKSNAHSQWAEHTYTGGAKVYRYDRLGRLERVEHTHASGCDVRVYGFDSRTNRTSKKTWLSDGACDGSGTEDALQTHTYDSADRLTDAGYRYDAFGRTVEMPTGLKNSFYANDLVASQTLNETTRQNWTLDPLHRFRGFTTETGVGGQWVNASSKLNHYGDDSDEPRWIVEDTTLGSWTRNVSGPDGDLAATITNTGEIKLSLVSLHGDVAATIDTGLTTPEVYHFDEYGIALSASADQQRYGWLGGKQRSAEALGDTILMGVRLYSPGIGRFLQVDPVDGGSATAYDYCHADPVNCNDLDGRWSWKKIVSKVAAVASVASIIPGPIGTLAGVVSAVAYAATGNWKEAAWAIGGAVAATVGLGAAVKGARLAVGAIKASRTIGNVGSKITSWGQKAKKIFSRCKGDNSFAPDTPVLMADGSWRPIGEIKVGDWVAAEDPQTGKRQAKPVLEVIVGSGTKHLVEIDLDGESGDTLLATGNHPIWAQGRGWTLARDLIPGDRLGNGAHAAVRSVTDWGWLPEQTVFNLNVGDVHTFIVGVDGEEVTAHNSACGVHGNSLKCTCEHYVYKIYKNGKTHRYGEGKGDRLPKQLAKLNRNNKGDVYTAEIMRRGLQGKAKAKAIETRLIRSYYKVYKVRPKGNKSWH